jgi:hypothetical protein
LTASLQQLPNRVPAAVLVGVPTPATATSTATAALVPGTLIDLSVTLLGNVGFVVTETGGAHAVTLDIWVSNDGANWLALGLAVNLDASDTGNVYCTLVTNSFIARYAQLAIADASSGSHGVISATGFAH